MRFFVLSHSGHEHPGAENSHSIARFALKKLASVPLRHTPFRIVRGAGADGDLVSLRGEVFAAPGVEGGDSGFIWPVINAENKYAQCRDLSSNFSQRFPGSGWHSVRRLHSFGYAGSERQPTPS